MKERLAQLKLDEPRWAACPVTFWDIYGKSGHPVRATISDMGPLLLGRLFNLNDTQQGVLTLVFKIADDNGLLLLDIKDLRAMLQFVGDKRQEFHCPVWQRFRCLDWRHPAFAAGDRAARGRQLFSASRCSTSMI